MGILPVRLRCIASGCFSPRRTGSVMCLDHWELLSAKAQRRIQQTYAAAKAGDAGAARCLGPALREAVRELVTNEHA